MYTNMYILLRIDYDCHRGFHFGCVVFSTQNIFYFKFSNFFYKKIPYPPFSKIHINSLHL